MSPDDSVLLGLSALMQIQFSQKGDELILRRWKGDELILRRWSAARLASNEAAGPLNQTTRIS